ncbi:MAG: NAD-dependent epimerase/dehydratase [Bacteroidetes bacterium]|nr:MAG: NAD-dependent epimerase/dehydratase [Bacteroidota bacterium]
MNHLIFGGSGFIGHHLEQSLLKNPNEHVYIFDLLKGPYSQSTYEMIDVRNKIETVYSPKKEDIIYNMAAVHRTPGHASEHYFETNIKGAQNVCDYARKHNIKTIVFTSSIAVYGVYESQKTEQTIPMPDIPYGISKLTAEYIHRLWQMEAPNNRRLIIVRPGVVFGQYENGNFTRLINAIARNRFFYPGRKDTIKACIYVKDLVNSINGMVVDKNEGVQLFNMTYEPAPTIEEICVTIARNSFLKAPRVVLPAWLLLLISKMVFPIIKGESFHPDRIKKLMVSNNINGEKFKNNHHFEFGLEKGLRDWILTVKFSKDTPKIH